MAYFKQKIKGILGYRYYWLDREPCKIVEGVFIGSVGAAMWKKRLLELRITSIVSVVDLVPPMYPNTFKYLYIDIPDRTESNILEKLPEAVEFI